jgi:hypothetical protein
MVVVAILGLLATVVVANLDNITRNARISAAARGFGNLLVFLRDTAKIQGRTMSVEVDLDGQRWRAIDEPSANEVPDERDREELTEYSSWWDLEEGLRLISLEFGARDVVRGDTIVVGFTPEGELRPAGFVAFFNHEENEDEDDLSVEISGLTGLISYHRGVKEAEEIRDEEDF